MASNEVGQKQEVQIYGNKPIEYGVTHNTFTITPELVTLANGYKDAHLKALDRLNKWQLQALWHYAGMQRELVIASFFDKKNAGYVAENPRINTDQFAENAFNSDQFKAEAAWENVSRIRNKFIELMQTNNSNPFFERALYAVSQVDKNGVQIGDSPELKFLRKEERGKNAPTVTSLGETPASHLLIYTALQQAIKEKTSNDREKYPEFESEVVIDNPQLLSGHQYQAPFSR